MSCGHWRSEHLDTVAEPDADRLEDWRYLLESLGDAASAATREQLAAEVVMLTHNRPLHEVNLRWHPRAEDLLWRPELQEAKRSEGGGLNIRYRRGLKRELLDSFLALVETRAPYLRVRYAF